MNIKKILWAALPIFLLTSALLSQTVTDMAEKEKDRRESLKGKKPVVVTNADLAKLKKTAAYVGSGSGSQTQGKAAGTASSTASTMAGPGTAPAPSLPVGVSDQQAQSSQAASQVMNQQLKRSLEEKYEKAKEYRELLELKMNSLQLQFFNLADTKSKDLVQKDISETYAKLLGAQEADNKAREDLEKFLGQSLKEKLSPIWIK